MRLLARSGIAALADIFTMIGLFLSRPVVQLQVGAFIAVMLIAWLLSAWTYSALLPRIGRRLARGRDILPRLMLILQRLNFPAVGLVLLYGMYYLFRAQGLYAGLLAQYMLVFWALLVYRLVVALLYTFFRKRSVQRYHHRLIAPFFYLLVTGFLLDQIISLPTLFELRVAQFFANPLTLGAIFIATVGLYFWIDTTFALQEGVRNFLIKRVRADPGTVEASLTIARYLILILGFVIVFNVLGLDPSVMAFITGGLSVGIGFSLRSVLGNFLSGLILMFERSLRPGDVIEVGGTLGVVDRLSVRATKVRTYNGIDIIIPNESLLTSNVTTYTGTDKRVRRVLAVGISYNSNPREVMKLLEDIAHEHPLVLKDPPPRTFLVGFGDSSIDLELRFWLGELNLPMTSDLYLMVWEAFAEHKIEIPFPQRDLHIRSGFEVPGKGEGEAAPEVQAGASQATGKAPSALKPGKLR